jgi:ABC-type branched-subunit amino acid transport system substrate-binding protein
MFEYWNEQYGDKVKHVGTLVPNVPAALSSANGIKAAAESVGWVFDYSRKYTPTEQDFTADVIRMERQGIEIIYLGASEVAQVAQIKAAADQQGYHPVFISPLAYAEDFVERVEDGGGSAEGVVGSSLYPMFFSESDASRIEEVALFQEWSRRVAPDSPINLFQMYSWTAAKLFVQALEAAGPQAKRSTLRAELERVSSFDAGGMLPERDPANGGASHCYILWEYRDGDYRRVDSPATGYRCDGSYHHVD